MENRMVYPADTLVWGNRPTLFRDTGSSSTGSLEKSEGH